MDVRERTWEGAWEHADDQDVGCVCCEGAPGAGVRGAAMEFFTSSLRDYGGGDARWVVCCGNGGAVRGVLGGRRARGGQLGWKEMNGNRWKATACGELACICPV